MSRCTSIQRGPLRETFLFEEPWRVDGSGNSRELHPRISACRKNERSAAALVAIDRDTSRLDL